MGENLPFYSIYSDGNQLFEVGDLAVYPAHGVGRIEAVETRIIEGEKHNFYFMRILENNMLIMIPTWNVDSVGLRSIVGKDEIRTIFEIMKIRQNFLNENQTWNRRYRDYIEKIRTGSLVEVAKVYRDLSVLKMGKDLSFGERKLYDVSKTLLIKELSMAKDMSEREVKIELKLVFLSI